MGIFNNFPYTNFHELNVDWILGEIKNIKEYVENYTAVNNVSYAGIWDITKQYPQWALVTDGDTSWLAKQPVPKGIPLENTDYWQKLADLDPRIAGIIVQLTNAENKIAEIESKIRGIPDYISATHAGFTPENPNVDLLNELISSKKTVYVASGEYLINKTIVIPRGCKLIFDGSVSSSAIQKTFHITGSEAYLYIRGMAGDGSGDGILVESTTSSVGNVIVDAPYIARYNNGLHLLADNETGIQNCEFNLNRIDNVNIGIHLECGNNGGPWINQNTFTSFWVACHDVANATGIKFTKGANQIDKFNGNTFTEFSCEDTRTIIDIDFAWNNSFDGFRFLENTGERSIICSSSSVGNEFRCVSGYTSPDFIEDNGKDNDYFIDVAVNGINVSSHFTFYYGEPVPLDRMVPTVVRNGVMSPWAFITCIEPENGESEINLSMKYSVGWFADSPIILKMPDSGLVVLRSWNGTLLFTNGGSYANSTAGILPVNGKTYMLYMRDSNDWGAAQID